jgi:lysozyme
MIELRRVTVLCATVLVLSLAAVPVAQAATARPAAVVAARVRLQPVRGLDISSYQHAGARIDWPQLAGHGISFVSVKVAESTYYRNPYYHSDVRAAAAAGLAVMPYVFANPGRVGGAPTARYAVWAAGNLRGPGRLPLVVDLENDPYLAGKDCYGLNARKMNGWIAGFVGQARALTGKWPVIYTTANWWRECTGATSRFRRDPLWLAAYGGTKPAVPSTWRHWTFWQYDNAGRLPGIGTADLDYYQPTGDLPALRPLARRTSRARPQAARLSRVKIRHLVKRRRRP